MRTAVALSIVASAAAGCSGGHGFLGTDFNPKGDIRVTSATSGSVLTTSAANPFHVAGGGFSIGITETNFQGPYTVTITAWNNNTNLPCYVPHTVTATGATAVELFAADNALKPGDPPPNPCTGGGTDVETAVISDGKGNSVSFYYTLG